MNTTSYTFSVVLLSITVATATSFIVENLHNKERVNDGYAASATTTDLAPQLVTISADTASTLLLLPERVAGLERRLDESIEQLKYSDWPYFNREIADLREKVNSLIGLVSALTKPANMATTREISHVQPEELNEQALADQAWEALAASENKYAQQGFDNAWAAEAEEALRNEFASYEHETIPGERRLTEDQLVTLECRSTTCRLELASSTDINMTLELLIHRTAGLFSSGGAHYTDAGEVVLFLNGNI